MAALALVGQQALLACRARCAAIPLMRIAPRSRLVARSVACLVMVSVARLLLCSPRPPCLSPRSFCNHQGFPDLAFLVSQAREHPRKRLVTLRGVAAFGGAAYFPGWSIFVSSTGRILDQLHALHFVDVIPREREREPWRTVSTSSAEQREALLALAAARSAEEHATITHMRARCCTKAAARTLPRRMREPPLGWPLRGLRCVPNACSVAVAWRRAFRSVCASCMRQDGIMQRAWRACLLAVARRGPLRAATRSNAAGGA